MMALVVEGMQVNGRLAFFASSKPKAVRTLVSMQTDTTQGSGNVASTRLSSGILILHCSVGFRALIIITTTPKMHLLFSPRPRGH